MFAQQKVSGEMHLDGMAAGGHGIGHMGIPGPRPAIRPAQNLPSGHGRPARDHFPDSNQHDRRRDGRILRGRGAQCHHRPPRAFAQHQHRDRQQREGEDLGVRLVDPPDDGPAEQEQAPGQPYSRQREAQGQAQQDQIEEGERMDRIDAGLVGQPHHRCREPGVELEVDEIAAAVPVARRLAFDVERRQARLDRGQPTLHPGNHAVVDGWPAESRKVEGLRHVLVAVADQPRRRSPHEDDRDCQGREQGGAGSGGPQAPHATTEADRDPRYGPQSIMAIP